MVVRWDSRPAGHVTMCHEDSGMWRALPPSLLPRTQPMAHKRHTRQTGLRVHACACARSMCVARADAPSRNPIHAPDEMQYFRIGSRSVACGLRENLDDPVGLRKHRPRSCCRRLRRGADRRRPTSHTAVGVE
eukprot:3230373-Prymnesium_polylepis.2